MNDKVEACCKALYLWHSEDFGELEIDIAHCRELIRLTEGELEILKKPKTLEDLSAFVSKYPWMRVNNSSFGDRAESIIERTVAGHRSRNLLRQECIAKDKLFINSVKRLIDANYIESVSNQLPEWIPPSGVWELHGMLCFNTHELGQGMPRVEVQVDLGGGHYPFAIRPIDGSFGGLESRCHPVTTRYGRALTMFIDKRTLSSLTRAKDSFDLCQVVGIILSILTLKRGCVSLGDSYMDRNKLVYT